MALPTITAPTYRVTLPSNNQKRIDFRPFLVKEEKLLLMALEGKDEQEMKSAIVQILENCIHTKGLDFSTMPIFDIEYLFLQLRAKSVGEIAEPGITCPKCEHDFQIKVDVSKIKPKIKKECTNRFMLDETNTMGITMKYPSLESSVILEKDDNYMGVLISSIDEIFTEEEVFKSSDHTYEEMEEFIESIQTSQLNKILEFYSEMPALEYKKECTCPVCDNKFNIELRGLQDFFI
jgi:hypothetical protein